MGRGSRTLGTRPAKTGSGANTEMAKPKSAGAARLIFSADSSAIRLQVLPLDVELSCGALPEVREHFPAVEQQCFCGEPLFSHGNIKKRGHDWHPPHSRVAVTRNASKRRNRITIESMTD